MGKVSVAQALRGLAIHHGGLLVVLLPGSVWLERGIGFALPAWGIEAIFVLSNFVGLGAAIWTFHHQLPPEPGDLDDPSW